MAQTRPLILLLTMLLPGCVLAIDEGFDWHTPAPMVAFACSDKPYPALRWSGAPRFVWLFDFNQTACLTDADEVLAYCQAAYSHLTIVNVAIAPEPVPFKGWCERETGSCPTELTVTPFICLPKDQEESVSMKPVTIKDTYFTGSLSSGSLCLHFSKWKQLANEKCHRTICASKRIGVARFFSLQSPCNSVDSAGYYSKISYVCALVDYEDFDLRSSSPQATILYLNCLLKHITTASDLNSIRIDLGDDKVPLI